jgi:hypothetical protein
METANLIMLIVSLLFLIVLSFFIFQIWIQSKETKLNIANFIQELNKGFLKSENNLKSAIDQINMHYSSENKPLYASVEILKEQLKELLYEIKKTKEDLLNTVSSNSETSDEKNKESIENLKTKSINKIIEIDDRIKELDKHLSEKLVNDITEIAKQNLEAIKLKQQETTTHFNKTSEEIKEELDKVLKAITEPLQIRN